MMMMMIRLGLPSAENICPQPIVLGTDDSLRRLIPIPFRSLGSETGKS